MTLGRLALSLFMVLTVLAVTRDAPAADLTYIYDELGRLRAVVDPVAGTAIYAYDAVGNLLSITRQGATAVAIIEFTPDSGPVGTGVTISGTGFSPTPSQNTVTFNGLTAFVTASTATQITTSVPAGATTGLIQVTAPGGSATSTTPFTVTGATAPTITGFTPAIGLAGTTLGITGTNFDAYLPANKVVVNVARAAVSAGSPTSLTTTIPTGTGSGRISVTTPGGTATSAADLFIPPPGFTVAQTQVTGRMAFGESRVVTLTTGNIGLLVFDGVAGQRASITSTTGAGGDGILYTPSGTVLGSWYFGNGLLDTTVLPVTGTYTILAENVSGSVTLTLYDVPPDVTATISPNGVSVNVTTTTPGQNAQLTFAGTATRWISLIINGPSFGYGPVTVKKPDGSTLASGGLNGNGFMFLDRTQLPTTGTYTIDINPSGANTGTLTVTLYDVVDVTGSLTINGSAVTVTITTPGQNAGLTFAGTAGQSLTLVVTNAGGKPMRFTVFNPDGSTLWTQFIQGHININLAVGTLTQTGTHTLHINYDSYLTEDVTVRLTSP